jgi:SAM-dependent methyltransferase
MNFIQQKLSFIRDNSASVLDIGAGSGSALRSFFAGKAYRSSDINPGLGVDIVADAHDLSAVSDASYDAVISFNLLEHLHSPQLAAQAIRRVLKPGGFLLLSTPFIHPYHGGSCPDYYRFSRDGLKYLYRDFSHVETANDGGFFLAVQYFIPQSLQWAQPIFRPLCTLLDRLFTARRASGHSTMMWAIK